MRDYVTDKSNAAILFVERKLDAVPDFVKGAAAVSRADLAPLADEAFADRSGRAYPIDTPVNIWRSYANASYHKVAGTLRNVIRKAADAHGITAAIEDIDAVFRPAKQAGAADAKTYALPGPNLYPINSAYEVELSMRKIAEDLSHMAALDAVVTCERLKEAAVRFGVGEKGILPALREIGTPRMPDFEKASALLKRRATAVFDKEVADAYVKLAECIADEDLEPETGFAYADLAHDLDMQSGVKHASHAVTLFFQGDTVESIKAAAELTYSINGHLIPIAAIKAIPAGVVAEQFRAKTASVIAEVAKYATYEPEVQVSLDALTEATRAKIVQLAVTHG